MTDAPMSSPGEVAGWPKLNLQYRTDAANIAPLLPPGITPGAEPIVQIGIYCTPILGEPEFGISTKVQADFDGQTGWYNLGMGIDQEAAVFISGELNGQPKFLCDILYFRLGDHVEARTVHQGYTFVEFKGEVTGPGQPEGGVKTELEWWTKYSRAIGGVEKQYDFAPHVVKVATTSEEVHVENLDGDLLLRDSPWDPVAKLLPIEEMHSMRLVTTKISGREITKAGPLDPDAFWPYADVIGGSRWPGDRGGPRH